jgi:4-amino-4-deoxychorismate lyase
MESPLCAPDDPGFRLIETFGYLPGEGVPRRRLHLARMARSAISFGIPFDVAAAGRLLDGLSGGIPLRCRLTLSAEGALDLVTAEMPAPAVRWRLALSDVRLNSQDVFLQHKTTRRALYDQARASLPPGADEMLFLNERGEVCEGTITNIVVTLPDGARLTPPLSSGCLPGVFRQSLLDAGAVRESVLAPQDLAGAAGISLINALRGEIPAIWASASA